MMTTFKRPFAVQSAGDKQAYAHLWPLAMYKDVVTELS
jgi:hypothetical protein